MKPQNVWNWRLDTSVKEISVFDHGASGGDRVIQNLTRVLYVAEILGAQII
jgi:hypothetical protein